MARLNKKLPLNRTAMGRIIAVSNHKGGVGKTTSCVNIGAGLSLMGKKVLLLDLDPQANMSQSLGVMTAEKTIYGVLKGQYTSQQAVLPISETLHLLPSELDLSGAEVELSSEAGREFLLREALDPLTNAYDFILIDCPPSLGLLTINAFTAVGEVLIPLQAEYLALQGLTKLVEVVEKVRRRLNPALHISGVIVTQFDQRKVLNRHVLESIREYFGEKVFDTRIRDNVALAEAPTVGTDIFRYSPRSYGAEDYETLCREILSRS